MEIQKIKIVGCTFENRQEKIKNMNPMIDALIIVREPENPYDENALKVLIDTGMGETKEEMVDAGYIPRNLAKTLAPQIDAGKHIMVHNYFIIGGGEKNLGILLEYSLS